MQEAHVRVLLQPSYERDTVPEVAGLGTCFEYLTNKEALAALPIHMGVKQ